MKFIQLNMWYGALRHKAIDFLKKENADIINMQEVDGGIKNAFHFGLKERLESKLDYKYSFYMPKIWQNLGGNPVSYGQLILSRYPITARYVENINGKAKRSKFMDDKDQDSINLLQHVQIKAHEKTFEILNYHGYWIWGTKKGSSFTEKHCAKILKYMKVLNQQNGIILSGDFNLAPNSKSLRIISAQYPDLVSKYKITTTRNELSYPKEPVDNIFVNDRVKVKSFKVPKVLISDHLPIIMEFE